LELMREINGKFQQIVWE